MNHIMFSPAFAQLTASPVNAALARPDGQERHGDAGYHEVSLARSGMPPLVFQGQLLVDDTGEHFELKLYETDDLDLVCIFDMCHSPGTSFRRLFKASTAEDLAQVLSQIDPLRLIDVTIPDEASAQHTLLELHSRIAAVRSALMQLSVILDVDVSDAIARLAALCDGDQTWLQ